MTLTGALACNGSTQDSGSDSATLTSDTQGMTVATSGTTADGGTTADTSTSTIGETTTGPTSGESTGEETTGEPLPVVTPRQLAPISGSMVTSRTPILEVILSEGTTGARFEVCEDRSCTVRIADFIVEGPAGEPPDDLPPGRLYWRAFGRGGDTEHEDPTISWEMFVPAKASSLANTWYGSTADYNGDGYDDFIPSGSELVIAPGGPQGPDLEAPLVIGEETLDYSEARALADLNGDGYTDFGIPFQYKDSVVVVYGGPEGPSEESVQVLDGSQKAFLFGTTVVGAGDINNDGFGDVVIGTQSVGIGDDAYAWVLPGGPDGVSLTPLTLLSESRPDCMNGCGSWSFALRPISCDVNGDREMDIIADGRYGMYVFHGSASLISSQPKIVEHHYGSIDCGDVNGDGYGDIVVNGFVEGQSTHDVWVYFGGDTGLSEDASAKVTLAANFPPGSSPRLRVLGDINGDGIDDIIAVARGEKTSDNAAFILRGDGAWPLDITEYPDANTSSTPRPMGDLNGDKVQDFASNRGGKCDDWIFGGSSEFPLPLLGGWSSDPWEQGPCDPAP